MSRGTACGLCFAVALTVALGWIFIFSPHTDVDSDHWGPLGLAMRYFGTVAFYPDPAASIQRGPVYPLFFALTMLLSGDWLPYCVYLGQAVLFAGTSALTCWMGCALFTLRSGLIAGLLAACHPLLFWYTDRFGVESLLVFLSAAWVVSLLVHYRAGTIATGTCAGFLLGLCILTKATFLPFILLVPMFLWLCGRPRAWMVALAALCVVLPWSFRNWQLTGTFIPVHALAGYNFQRGDDFADHISAAPLAYGKLWEISNQENPYFRNPDAMKFDQKWQYELWFDHAAMHDSMERYRNEPLFLLKKIAINAWAFWFLGNTAGNTLVFLLLQGTLLLFFLRSAVNVLRAKGWRSREALPLFFILFYFIFHLPLFAFARLSVVLIPAMLPFAAQKRLDN